jgi:hypothetical protein
MVGEIDRYGEGFVSGGIAWTTIKMYVNCSPLTQRLRALRL